MVAPSSCRRTQTFRIELPVCGRTLPFVLHSRPLQLGPDVAVRYFWMDTSTLRSGKDSINLGSCLSHFILTRRPFGAGGDIDDQVLWIAAQCFPLVASDRSMQQVYKDAFLFTSRRRTEVAELADTDRRRIRSVVRSRDRERVLRELDRTLGRFESPSRVLPLMQEAFRRWVGTGVTLALLHDRDGVEPFLAAVDFWRQKIRKDGGSSWARLFLNMFAYEAKVSFYTCFANAWIDLIPWLRAHRDLDPTSERFLRFWHMQNQPIEIPHGRTASGIAYPTRGKIELREVGDGPSRRHVATWKTEQIGPTHVPAVFRGQVLSLHPLSGFFMKDPALCAVAGRYFGDDSLHPPHLMRSTENVKEYWDLIGAILTAAAEYRQALDAQNGARQRPHLPENTPSALEKTQNHMIEDYLADQRTRCPKCGSGLRPASENVKHVDGDRAAVHCRCVLRNCDGELLVTLDYRDLKAYLLNS